MLLCTCLVPPQTPNELQHWFLGREFGLFFFVCLFFSFQGLLMILRAILAQCEWVLLSLSRRRCYFWHVASPPNGTDCKAKGSTP